MVSDNHPEKIRPEAFPTAPTATARLAATSTIFSCCRPKGTNWLISMSPAPVPRAYATHMK